ncbi:MAG: hypothetical protein D6800_00395 [Candidatus Zixiibacteriota bacterium]|nr:MAG: hypothetical protein D6800_00395 [candidate division Zixibacteria bacterium]
MRDKHAEQMIRGDSFQAETHSLSFTIRISRAETYGKALVGASAKGGEGKPIETCIPRHGNSSVEYETG